MGGVHRGAGHSAPRGDSRRPRLRGGTPPAPRPRPGGRPRRRAGHRRGSGTRRDRARVLREGGAPHGRALQEARAGGLLRRDHLPPGGPGLRHPGRRSELEGPRSAQRRPRRSGLHHRGRVLGRAPGPRHRLHGAHRRTRLRREPVLHRAATPAAPRRPLHRLRPGGPGHGRGRPDRRRSPGPVRALRPAGSPARGRRDRAHRDRCRGRRAADAGRRGGGRARRPTDRSGG